MIVRQPFAVTETDRASSTSSPPSTAAASPPRPGALRHGISRALCVFNLELRKQAQEGGLPDARRPDQGAQEVRTEGRASPLPVQQALGRFTSSPSPRGAGKPREATDRGRPPGMSLKEDRVVHRRRATPTATRRSVAATVSMKELLEAGVHFGHQTRRWNPKMKEFIFGERNGIYIIDLQKTHELLQDALQFVQDLAAAGQDRPVRRHQAAGPGGDRRGGPALRHALRERALAGRAAHQLRDHPQEPRPPARSSRSMPTDGRHERLTKKEARPLREGARASSRRTCPGIKAMKSLPDAVFVIDTRKEAIAVAEARKLKHPGDRRGRHQLRSRRGRRRDPRQRRRAAGHPALRGPDRRRGARGPGRCAAARAAATPPPRRARPRPARPPRPRREPRAPPAISTAPGRARRRAAVAEAHSFRRPQGPPDERRLVIERGTA